MPDYILTNKALEDISRIWDYTYRNWSEEQADKYYNLILSSFDALGDKSAIGKKYSEIHPDVYGYKIGQHIIFYRTARGGKIEIARVLHSSMDLKSRINE